MISIETLASTLAPSDRVTHVLRAALLEGPEAANALRSWQLQERNPTQALAGPETVSLAPTLSANLQLGAGLEGLDPRLATYLKTALVHEQLRLDACRSILEEVLHALGRQSLRVLVTGGVLNGETLYAGGLRHSHDIDLLVRPEERRVVGQALEGVGFTPRHGTESHHLTLVHPKGLPVCVHDTALVFRAYDRPSKELLERPDRYEIVGRTVEGPRPEERFLQACVNGLTGGRAGVLWVCDAVLLARRSRLDGTRMVTAACAAHCALPLWIALTYLERRLDVGGLKEEWLSPTDRTVLEQEARASDKMTRETLLQGAWSAGRSSLSDSLRNCRSIQERLFLLRAKALPSFPALVGSNRLVRRRELARLYWDRVRRRLKITGL